jgi:hypothetical protein
MLLMRAWAGIRSAQVNAVRGDAEQCKKVAMAASPVLSPDDLIFFF